MLYTERVPFLHALSGGTIMHPPRQLLSNDREHALFEASGRDSLRLVPEVAMAAAAESLASLGVGYQA
jgi:hypothetical protein